MQVAKRSQFASKCCVVVGTDRGDPDLGASVGQAKLARSLSPTVSPQLSTQVRKCVASPGRPSAVGPRIPGPPFFPRKLFPRLRWSPHSRSGCLLKCCVGGPECGARMCRGRARTERRGGSARGSCAFSAFHPPLERCGCGCGCGCQKSGVASRPGSVDGGAARNPRFGRSGSFPTGSGAGSIQHLRYITPRRRDSSRFGPRPLPLLSVDGGRVGGEARPSGGLDINSQLDRLLPAQAWMRKQITFSTPMPVYHSTSPCPMPSMPCMMDRSPTPQTPNMLTAPMLPLPAVVAIFFFGLCENLPFPAGSAGSLGPPPHPFRRRRPNRSPTGEGASPGPRCRS